MSWLKKIWNWIVSIPHDKLLHLLAGLLINAYSLGIAYRIVPFWWAVLIGFVFALVVLILKEVYDRHHGGSVEVMDVVYGLIGVALIDIAFIAALA